MSSDDDSFNAFQLRYKFEDHAFGGLVWRSLREVGWTYAPTAANDAYYSTPDKLDSFRSGTDIQKYLDQFVPVPEIRGNLQLLTSQTFSSPEYEERGRRLRTQVLRDMYERAQKEPEQEDHAKESSSEVHSLSTTDRTRRSGKASSSAPPLSSNNINQWTSVTATEHGTHMYLHRNSKKGKKKAVTGSSSSTDVSSLSFPSLEGSAALMQQYASNDGEIQRIEAEYKSDFGDWRFLLSTNHSLLLYGAGSKYNLLNSFAEEELSKEGYILVIDGFQKEADAEGILDILVDSFLDGKEPQPMRGIDHKDGDFPVVGISSATQSDDLVDRAIYVSRALAHKASETLVPIFVVIHNIEGDGLRTRIQQDALAALVVNSTVANGVASIRLVASFDHVDTPALLWSPATATNFSWIWKEVHTRRPHSHELVMLKDQERRKAASKKDSEGLALTQKAASVLQHLAPRHTEVLQILARLQLEAQTSDGSSKGVSYFTWRDRCKASFAVNKNSVLDTYLNELKDHGLVCTKVDELWMPYGKTKLREILSYKRDSA